MCCCNDEYTESSNNRCCARQSQPACRRNAPKITSCQRRADCQGSRPRDTVGRGSCHCAAEESWNRCLPPKPQSDWAANFGELRRRWSEHARRQSCPCDDCKTKSILPFPIENNGVKCPNACCEEYDEDMIKETAVNPSGRGAHRPSHFECPRISSRGKPNPCCCAAPARNARCCEPEVDRMHFDVEDVKGYCLCQVQRRDCCCPAPVRVDARPNRECSCECLTTAECPCPPSERRFPKSTGRCHVAQSCASRGQSSSRSTGCSRWPTTASSTNGERCGDRVTKENGQHRGNSSCTNSKSRTVQECQNSLRENHCKTWKQSCCNEKMKNSCGNYTGVGYSLMKLTARRSKVGLASFALLILVAVVWAIDCQHSCFFHAPSFSIMQRTGQSHRRRRRRSRRDRRVSEAWYDNSSTLRSPDHNRRNCRCTERSAGCYEQYHQHIDEETEEDEEEDECCCPIVYEEGELLIIEDVPRPVERTPRASSTELNRASELSSRHNDEENQECTRNYKQETSHPHRRPTQSITYPNESNFHASLNRPGRSDETIYFDVDAPNARFSSTKQPEKIAEELCSDNVAVYCEPENSNVNRATRIANKLFEDLKCPKTQSQSKKKDTNTVSINRYKNIMKLNERQEDLLTQQCCEKLKKSKGRVNLPIDSPEPISTIDIHHFEYTVGCFDKTKKQKSSKCPATCKYNTTPRNATSNDDQRVLSNSNKCKK